MTPRPPCKTCDFIGPELPCLATDGRALHRALADIGWALVDATHLQEFVDWLSDRLARRPR